MCYEKQNHSLFIYLRFIKDAISNLFYTTFKDQLIIKTELEMMC